LKEKLLKVIKNEINKLNEFITDKETQTIIDAIEKINSRFFNNRGMFDRVNFTLTVREPVDEVLNTLKKGTELIKKTNQFKTYYQLPKFNVSIAFDSYRFSRNTIISFLNMDGQKPTNIKEILYKKLKNVKIEGNEMNNSDKLREYIRKIINDVIEEEKIKEDDPYGKPDEDKYLFKTGQDYLRSNFGKTELEEEKNKDKKENKESERERKYRIFFNNALSKFGFSNVSSMPKDIKKQFFDYIDKNWKSKEEESNNIKEEKNNYSSNDLIEIDFNLAKNLLLKGYVVYLYDDNGKKPNMYDNLYILTKNSKDYKLNIQMGGLTPIEYGLDNIVKSMKSKGAKDVKFYTLYKKEPYIIDETSSTGGVAGYETPFAFTGKKGISDKQKRIATQLGYELIDKSYTTKNQENSENLKDKLNESLNSYYFKDENLTAEQKLGLAVRYIKDSLNEIEKITKKTIQLKQENNIDSNKVGKRILSSLKRINEKVIRLMISLQELK